MNERQSGNGAAGAGLPALHAGRRAVRRWAKELPAGNLTELGRLLVAALREANRRPEREGLFHLLEAIGPSAAAVLDHLTDRFALQPVPLDRAGSVSAGLAIELLGGLMRGYANVLNVTDTHVVWPWRQLAIRKQRATALHRVFSYGERFIGIHRLLRLELPEGVWRRVHRCYRVAETEGLCDRKAGRPVEGSSATSTAQEYRRLLLAMLLPADLPPRQQAQIRATLDEWARLAVLRRPGAEAKQAHYLVQLENDCGAIQVAGMDFEGRMPEGVRLMHTDELARRIARGRDAPEQVAPLDAAVLGVLNDAWCTARRRTEARSAEHAPAEVAIGSASLLVCGGRSAPVGGKATEQTAESVLPGSEVSVRGRILNRSDSGLSVAVPLGRVAVGTPVAVRSPGESWRPGVVVRARRREGEMELGVKFHLRGAMPARLHAKGMERPGPEFDVVVGRTAEGAWALLAPRIALLRDGTLVLTAGERRRPLRRGASLFRSRQVELFLVEPVDGEPADFTPSAPVVSRIRRAEGAMPVAVARDREGAIGELMARTGLNRSDAELVVEMARAAG
jgi:hypothetical protein